MEKLAGVSKDTVRRRTGRDWQEWITALDAASAHTRTHAEIARLLEGAYGLESWWAQTVTVGYEQAKGLRTVNQKADGFATSVSRTSELPAVEVYARWVAGKWQNLAPGATISTKTAPKSVRIRMADGSRVAVSLSSRPNGKTAIQVQHEKLSSAEELEPSRRLWRAVIDAVLADDAAE